VTNLLLITFLASPLIGALVAGLTGRRIGDKPSMAITTGLLFLSCALAWNTFYQVVWGAWSHAFTIELLPFINVGDFKSAWSIRVDTLSAVMGVVVTTVSALVHLYSWGYMADDDAKPRFFAYLSLFTFAMLMLVNAADFMQLFFGWEGVGLASYLLIGFWFKKPTASAAAIKAFVVNRVGDFGFALGIMTVYWMFHTIQFATLFPQIAGMAGKTWHFAAWDFSALDLAGVLLFIGAMGKSAQFFLHTWLPDAMEGPTPVSALIHAATMVTAGVYMVCLLSPLYEYAPNARALVIVIGAVTSLFAATVGMMQNDIKRVIAYSTCSQLGYMFFAAGVGAYQSAMFHLFTHAFFKALLFLGAGSVIHAMHHEQDMRKMGGLWKTIPITFTVMTIGTIAITGLGIPGVEWGFAGFYSKDSILGAAFAAGASQPLGYFAYVVGVFVAGLTSYYSWRLAFFTFNGHARWGHGHDDHAHVANGHDAHAHDGHGDQSSAAQQETHSEPDVSHADDHGHDHTPHESPWVMLIPLLVLSVGAVAAGFVFFPDFVGKWQESFWRGAIFTGAHNHVLEGAEAGPKWVGYAPLAAAIVGMIAAAYVYLWREGLGAKLAGRGGPLYTFFYNKWYFDELYEAVFVNGAKWFGDLFWKGGDQKVIDGFGPNGVSWLMAQFGKGLGRIQTGYIYTYAFVMLLGLAGLLTLALMAWQR
jgi:NADH-quinone oxidoreductase subunit L